MMQRFDLHPSAARTSVNFGSSSRLTNLGPGTVSYADSDEDTAQGTLAPAATVNLSETRYLWADATATVRVEDLTVGTDAQRLEALEADVVVIKEAPLNARNPPSGYTAATGDGTTDDRAALMALINAIPVSGGEIYLAPPSVGYKISSALTWSTKPIRLFGPVACNSTPGPSNASGTKIIVATGQSGIIVQNGVNGYGSRSIIENLHLINTDASAGTNDGIRIRANGMAVKSCKVEGFGGSGIHVLSGVDGTPFVVDGQNNANCWYVEHTRCSNNKTHGFFAEGIDSNAGLANMLDCTGNTGAGIYEDCPLGNTYIAPHLDGNVAQAIRCGANGGYSRFLGVYKEGDAFPAVLIDAGNDGRNVIDFRVMTAGGGETITDNSGSGDSVIVTPAGFLKQNRLIIGTGATTSFDIEPSAIWFGSGNEFALSRYVANVMGVSFADLAIVTAGKGLKVAEGANAKMGRSTLVGGTVVVSTTAVTAASEIFLTCQTPGGTPGFLHVSARVAGTSFTILSSSGTDTSVVGWMIVEPT